MQPQEQKLDAETIERWRREAVTSSARDRLWPNRCEALCNALRHAQSRLDRVENEAPDYIKRIIRG